MPYRHIDEAVIAFTLDEIVYCNQKAANLLKYVNPEHLIGVEPLRLVSDEHYFDILMGAKTALSTGKGNSSLCTLLDREDSHIPCILRYAYSDEENCFFAIIRPIIEREEEKKIVRFLELVRSDLDMPEKVVEGNTKLASRMKLNKEMLAESLSEIKEHIEELRLASNWVRDMIPSIDPSISAQQQP